MAASGPSVSCVNGRRWTSDVFLSSDETTQNFTQYLYSSLTDAGIRTFRKADELPDGEESSGEELVRAIHGSQICLIVFSKCSAESRSCLEEVREIVESSRVSQLQLILPVFYDVDPSDLQKQSDQCFSQLFSSVEQSDSDSERVAAWKAALMEVASLPGWNFRSFANRQEGKFMKKIVKNILQELSVTLYLNVATYPVGIEPRVQKLSSQLAVGSKPGPLFLGICGSPGTGKTTLSKAIYNHFFHCFDARSFLPNIRDNSTSQTGLIRLQQQLLHDVVKKHDDFKIATVEEGCSVIKESLCHKRALVILDDVDQMGQIEALCARRDWLGMGSRVVITTRNVQVLEAIGVEEVYETGGFLLSEDEGLELFCWHAFQRPSPDSEEFVECSREIASHFRELPLALEVLGSFLCGRAISQWRSAFEKWKGMSHEQILRCRIFNVQP